MRSTQIPCWENEELGRNEHSKPVISGAHVVVVVHPAIQLGRHDRGLHSQPTSLGHRPPFELL